MTPSEILKMVKAEMQKALDHTLHEFNSLHTGKASPTMVESISVEAYGSTMALRDVAAIMTPDARTITIEPWDQSVLKDIEKAIQKANIGINPSIMGNKIFCPLPELSGDRRKELVKVCHGMAEQGKVGIRAARRDGMDGLKAAAKDKEISEDDQKRGEKEVQAETDKFNAEIDKHLKAKEAELMAV